MLYQRTSEPFYSHFVPDVLGLFWREDVTAFNIVQVKSATAFDLYCTFVNLTFRDIPMSAHVTSPSFSLSIFTHPTALQSVVEPRPLSMTAAKLFCSARPSYTYGTGAMWQCLLVHLPAISSRVSHLVNCQWTQLSGLFWIYGLEGVFVQVQSIVVFWI